MSEEKKEAYEFSVAGFKLKLNSAFLAMAIPIATTVGGAMWGGFEFYQDYLNMKKKIANYVAPDLGEFDKRLAIIEQNQNKTTSALQDSANKTADYTRDIKNDLKNDIRRNEAVTEQIERSVKQAQRETEQEMRQARKDIREDLEKARTEVNSIRKDMGDIRKEMAEVRKEIDKDVERLKKEVDSKIQKAIDNPLNNR